MPNRMERFTTRASRVLSLAQQEAERLGSQEIDSEHMLLGLMLEEGGIAARVLKGVGIEVFQIQALINELTRDQEKNKGRAIDLSAGTKRSLESAVESARALRHNYIGTEHLLLGLLGLQEGIALDILRRLDVSADAIREGVEQTLRDHAASSAATNTPQSTRRPIISNVDFLLIRMSSRASGIRHFPLELSAGIKNALEEALKELGHSGFLVLEERHLLLGLLRNPDGAVSRALRDMGIERAQLIQKLREADDE